MWLWWIKKINISILWKSTCNYSRQIYLPKTTLCIGHMHGKLRFHHPFLAQWVDTLGRHGISGTERVWVGWVGRHRWPRFLSRYFLFYPSPSHFCQYLSEVRVDMNNHPFGRTVICFDRRSLQHGSVFRDFRLPSWALDIGSLSWKTDWGSHLVYMHTKLLIFVHAKYLYMQTCFVYIRIQIHMLLTPFFLGDIVTQQLILLARILQVKKTVAWMMRFGPSAGSPLFSVPTSWGDFLRF